MKSCRRFIAMISKNTMQAEGARWEMKCAHEEGIPVLGIQIHRDEPGRVPPETGTSPAINWDWDRIGRFIDGL
jgi:hypothetical protein